MFAVVAIATFVLAFFALSLVLSKQYVPVVGLYSSALCIGTTGHRAPLNVLHLPLPAPIRPRRSRTIHLGTATGALVSTLFGACRKAATVPPRTGDIPPSEKADGNTAQGTFSLTAPLCRSRAFTQTSERTYTCAVEEVGISPSLWCSSSLDNIESKGSPTLLLTSPSGRAISPRARWNEGEFTDPEYDADKLHDGWRSHPGAEGWQAEDELEKLEEDRARLDEGNLAIIVEAQWAAPDLQDATWTVDKDITLEALLDMLNEEFGVTIWLAHTGEFAAYNIRTEEHFEEWKMLRYEFGMDFAVLAKSPEQIAEERAGVDAEEAETEQQDESIADEAFASVEQDMLTDESLSETETMLNDELGYDPLKDMD